MFSASVVQHRSSPATLTLRLGLPPWQRIDASVSAWRAMRSGGSRDEVLLVFSTGIVIPVAFGISDEANSDLESPVIEKIHGGKTLCECDIIACFLV